jgi:hypothetical protein
LDGCWIGLSDDLGTGNFRWIVDERLALSDITPMFMDFRRTQPDNHTVSRGHEATGGERCVATTAWMSDPLIQEQGGWNDEFCGNGKSFICQTTATTNRFVVTVDSSFAADGGDFRGGVLNLGSSVSIVQSLKLSLSASLSVGHGGNITVSSLTLIDSSLVTVNGTLALVGGVLGEPITSTLFPAQSTIVTGNQSHVIVSGNVIVAARMSAFGAITIGPSGNLELQQVSR